MSLLKNYVAGTRAIIEWFGSRMDTVPTCEAERRSLVCSTCPLNRHSTWREAFGEYATTLIGIRHWLRHSGKFTSRDWQLHVCDACNCPMRIKIWCPLDIIKNNMTEETKTKLHSQCWMK